MRTFKVDPLDGVTIPDANPELCTGCTYYTDAQCCESSVAHLKRAAETARNAEVFRGAFSRTLCTFARQDGQCGQKIPGAFIPFGGPRRAKQAADDA